jgi:D-serine deaminase-like pyridoxal phosphate-dependent protein
MIEVGEYRVADGDSLETPAMLVFQSQLDHNIRTVCDLAGGGDRLMVHVKTHKSAAVTRRQLEAGVAGFKCATLKELEMVLDQGAIDAVLAYPLQQRRKVERLLDLCAAHPRTQVAATCSDIAHLELLGQAAADRRQDLRVMLDLDVGMHRTGIAPGDEAEELYRALAARPRLVPSGLHVYDGHEHISDPATREAAARRHIDVVVAFRQRLEAAGLTVPRVIGGGSFSFPFWARTPGMQGSPGTCVYWDHGYAATMPDMPFKWAALVLGQVVDRHPAERTVTMDLGTKAVAPDPPTRSRLRVLGCPEAELVGQNEEHAIFSWAGDPPSVGTYFLAVPGHVCPTTICYPGSYLIDDAGEVIDFYPHTARDRR